MKKLFVVLPLVALIAACGSNKDPYEKPILVLWASWLSFAHTQTVHKSFGTMVLRVDIFWTVPMYAMTFELLKA